MSVIYAPDSAYAKEMVKHEAQYSPFGPGLRPHVYRDYPMMMHRAGRPAGGMGVDTIVETRIVTCDAEETCERSNGFRRTPLEALSAFESQELEIAKLAAERNYDVKHKLSEKAAAEVALHEAAHGGHLASIPVTPIKKRGRPAKVKESADGRTD